MSEHEEILEEIRILSARLGLIEKLIHEDLNIRYRGNWGEDFMKTLLSE